MVFSKCKLFWGFIDMNHGEIQAVHSDELLELLQSLDIYNDFIQKKCKCRYCDAVINEKNLLAIIPNVNEILFCCINESCNMNMDRKVDNNNA